MESLKQTIKINKPVVKVFAFTINPANTPKWIDSVTVEETNEWPVEVGTIYRNQNQAGEWSEYKLTDFEPNKTFTLSKSDSSLLHYSFTALDAETTELEYEWTSNNPDKVFLEKMLTKLKKVMEEKRRVFIIHAWGETPESCWYQWLKENLESQDVEVIVPEMPNTDAPDMKTWVEALAILVSTPNENTFFVGHSIGCQTILRYLETLDEQQKVGGAVFVAPWTTLKNLSEESQQIAKPWLETPLNWQAAKNHCPQFAALFSDNDEWVEASEEKVFQDNLGAKTQMMGGMGHFDKMTELPELTQLVNATINNYKEVK
jgi:uncharacterized protein